MPFDGDPRAAYALVHEDGSVEHRRVAYDHEASAAYVRAAFRRRGLDGGDRAPLVACSPLTSAADLTDHPGRMRHA